MSKLSIFAAVALFWVLLSASLMRVQLVASPVYKMRVPTSRSMPIRSMAVMQAQPFSTTTSHN